MKRPRFRLPHLASKQKKQLAWALGGLLLVAGLAYGALRWLGGSQGGSPEDLFGWLGGGQVQAADFEVDDSYAQYLSAFTSGYISNRSPIRVRFRFDAVSQSRVDSVVAEELFKFDPGIEGRTYWEDTRTLVFRPENPLERGQYYQASFKLGKVLNVKEKHQEFDFSFQAKEQSYHVEFEGLGFYSRRGDYAHYKGTLTTADLTEATKLEKTFKAQVEGQEVPLQWVHKGRKHTFTLDSIERKNYAKRLKIAWDGKNLGLDVRGKKVVDLPASGDFQVMEVKTQHMPDQAVEVVLSNPVSIQSVAGMITLKETDDLRLVTDKNRCYLYPNEALEGEYQLKIRSGLKDRQGRRLGQTTTKPVTFKALKPAVRPLSNGIIMPQTDKCHFGFEAVNLRAVEVRVTRIFESNIPHFLQENALDGSRDLAQAGRPIAKKIIRLPVDNPQEYRRWRQYGIDLSEFVETEPGALYRVHVGFRQEYTAWPCKGELPDIKDLELEKLQTFDEEETGFIRYNHYFGENYDWREDDNPCNGAYYKRSRMINQNFLASNIGLIAKKGTDGSLFLTATNLLEAKPLSEAKLQVLDEQLQPMGQAATDEQGHAHITTPREPFLVVAQKGKEKGYLKVEDQQALPTSMFETEGQQIEKGMKGMIYGERGVWRPGDTLFLTFLLNDAKQALPDYHPVVFELYNPKNQLYSRQVRTEGLNNFFRFTTPTEKDVKTGNWLARVKVGGATFEKSLKIEAIMPNRLKIDLEADETPLPGYGQTRLQLHSEWLTGATAANLKATTSMALSPAETDFKGYPDYTFADPSRSYSGSSKTLFDGRLDGSGHAAFPTYIDQDLQEEAPGKMEAHFSTRVYEPGGAFSVDRRSMKLSPFTHYVGLKVNYDNPSHQMLYTGKKQNFQIATLTEEGRKASRQGLRVRVYKIRWRWWWEDGGRGLSRYVGSSHHEPVKDFRINSRNGQASFSLQMDEDDWGRYLVHLQDPKSGHATGQVVYFDWANWMERDRQGSNSGASVLTFSSDKTEYQVGEEVELSIPSPADGRMLVTVENGSRVLQSYWAQAEEGTSELSFEVSEDMAPNVYVYVTLMQPHAQTTNDLPLRMYGILPLEIHNPETELQPEIAMPKELKPEKPAKIRVSEAHGKPMTYTLAMVDEGLLDLTNFPTPDPHAQFFAKEALGVRTFDLFDEVIGAYGGRLEQILTIGGGAQIEGQRDAQQNRFKPMVRYLGPFQLEKGQTQIHTIDMPRYVGSVRTMVVAGQKGAYGKAEKTTPVRNPLMLLGTLPRVVSPGETVKLPVNVFAMKKGVEDVSVSIKPSGLFRASGATTKRLHFEKQGDQVVNFELQVPERIGRAKVRIEAQSGPHKATHEIALKVRAPNPEVYDVQEFLIKPGETTQKSFESTGMQGTREGHLEVSALPAINLNKRLKFLIRYPHGCIEQTTSSAFPQLVLGELINLSARRKQEIQKNIEAAIQRLGQFQLSSGGFSYWPGNDYVSNWGTNYAGHFLLEAQKRGYQVPGLYLNRWFEYQKEAALAWEPGQATYANKALTQAYRLYTLALGGKPALSAMNRLKAYDKLKPTARWRLAAAYALAGFEQEAESLTDGAPKSVRQYRQLSHTYGSSERDRAMILEALTLMGQEKDAAPMLKKVAKDLGSQRWLSTQTTAYGLLAVGKFVEESGSLGNVQFRASINGKQQDPPKGNSSIFEYELPVEKKSGQVTVENQGKGLLYGRLITSGIPAASKETSSSSNLDIEVAYQDMEGQPLDVSNLPQGTDFIAQVSIINPGKRGKYEEMVLEQIFPSGWEILNTRMDRVQATKIKNSAQEYRDIRDDRVNTYFGLAPKQTKQFTVLLNAAYQGRFYLPGTSSYAMYDESIAANSKGQWIRVVEPPRANP